MCSYFHDSVPVVPGGHSEQGEEGHPKILEGGVPAQTLTRVVVVAL